MESETNAEKQKILEGIFLKKEDTLKSLQEIVNKSKEDFSIDLETLEVLFRPHVKKIPDKILRLLIAFFLMKENRLMESDSLNLTEMGKRLGIKSTSLSKPLGELINHGFVKRTSEGSYSIVHHKILEILGRERNG